MDDSYKLWAALQCYWRWTQYPYAERARMQFGDVAELYAYLKSVGFEFHGCSWVVAKGVKNVTK